VKALGAVSELLSEGRRQRESGGLFAKTHFPGCVVHLEEAAAVHRALERLSRRQHPDLDPDVTVSELLRDHPNWQAMDSLEIVEFVMAVEEEFRQGQAPISYPTPDEALGAAVLRALRPCHRHHCMDRGDHLDALHSRRHQRTGAPARRLLMRLTSGPSNKEMHLTEDRDGQTARSSQVISVFAGAREASETESAGD